MDVIEIRAIAIHATARLATGILAAGTIVTAKAGIAMPATGVLERETTGIGMRTTATREGETSVIVKQRAGTRAIVMDESVTDESVTDESVTDESVTDESVMRDRVDLPTSMAIAKRMRATAAGERGLPTIRGRQGTTPEGASRAIDRGEPIGRTSEPRRGRLETIKGLADSTIQTNVGASGGGEPMTEGGIRPKG